MRGLLQRLRLPKLKTVLLGYTLLIVVVVIVAVSLVSYAQFESIMTERIAMARVDVLRQVSERINRNNNTISVLSDFYYNNLPMDDIMALVAGNDSAQASILEALSTIDAISERTVKATGIACHYVLSLENGFFRASNDAGGQFSLNNYQKKLWYATIVRAQGEPVWISTYRNFSAEREFVYSLARSVIDPLTGESIGIFLFNVDEANISSSYESMITTNAIYVVDSVGKMVSHSNKGMLGIKFYDMDRLSDIVGGRSYCTIRKNHEDYLFSNYTNDAYDWLLVEEIPMEDVLTPLLAVQRNMLLLDAIVLVASAAIIYAIAIRTTRPLKKLSEGLRKVGDTGEKPGPFENKGWHEISVIGQECNSMLERIDALILDVKRTESEKRRAQMCFMQAQINPHFVYNTLFSIKCLVDMGSKESALGIIDCFTAILKDVLSVNDDMSTVGSEFRLLEQYAALQKYRYGDIFDLHVRAAADLEDCGMLRMLLQPIIENAIFHGIANLDRRGEIVVTAEHDGGDMRITIRDNGTGMASETLEKLKSNDLASMSSQSNMIGLKNISERIAAYFGGEYGLDIDSRPGCGTVVTLKLPILKN